MVLTLFPWLMSSLTAFCSLHLSSAAPLSAAAVMYHTITFCCPCALTRLSGFALLPFPWSLPSRWLLRAVAFLHGFSFLNFVLAAFPLKMHFDLSASNILARPVLAVPAPAWSSPAVPVATTCMALNVSSEAAVGGPYPAHSNSQKLREMEEEDGRAWPERWYELPGQGKWVPLGFGVGGQSMVLWRHFAFFSCRTSREENVPLQQALGCR